MSGFEICFISPTDKQSLARGAFLFADSDEIFEASIGYWSREDYEISWKHAARKLIEGAPCVVFWTNVFEPEYANFFNGWVAYHPSPLNLVFYEKLFLAEQFELAEMLRVGSSRPLEHEAQLVTDSAEVSKWHVTLSDLQSWIDTQEG